MARRRESNLMWLIRCGETTWDCDRRLQGAADLPLSETGRSQVATEAARDRGLEIGAVFHPPDEAATDTARLFAEAHGGRARTVDDLGDPDLGLLQGLTEQVFAERYPKRYKQWEDDPISLSPPEGEDLIDARARILGAVARILRRSRGDELAIVLHPFGLAALRCWLADRPDRDLWSVLESGPAVERYAMTPAMVQWLDDAAAATVSSRS